MINNKNFKLTDIPKFHPVLEHYERLSFWKAEKRKCIEGYWQQGKWMPGPLYYYVNFHNIQFEDDSSVAQAFGLPFLRDIDLKLKRITKEELKRLKYIPAREYLRKNHGKNLGKPLYKNSAKHFISIQSRGGGKSYATSGIAEHNFLFDGATDYDDYLSRKKTKNFLASDTIIGAIDTKYSIPLMKKVTTTQVLSWLTEKQLQEQAL